MGGNEGWEGMRDGSERWEDMDERRLTLIGRHSC
jgi:hypothetical protein